MPSQLQRSTWTNNFRFLADPAAFMRTTLIDATRRLERSMLSVRFDPKKLLHNCRQVFDFDLVPVSYSKCCLEMRGPKSEFKGGPAVRARFLGFAFNVEGAHQIARITATDDTTPIFTVGITGCTVIGIRSRRGLRFFHEPTRQDRRLLFLNEYPGQVVIHAPSTTGYGTAFMQRDGDKWQVLMQSFNYDEAAWILSSKGGTDSANFYNFYSAPKLTVHTEGSTREHLRTSLLSRRAAMGYED